MKAIEVEEVSYGVGGHPILSDVTFSVEDGDVFGLLGPSGCGKSTTLRLISGLSRPTKGSVRIFGKNAAEYVGSDRCVATVWQSRALFPHMTVRENIGFGLKIRKFPLADCIRSVDSMAEKLGLADKLDRNVSRLSGGEQQRVALARALITKPKVILLDEPFTGLDQKLKLRLQADLRDLRTEYNCTYVLVSHAQEDVFSLADSMAVIDGGRIVQIGRPTEVYNRPENALVAELVGYKNLIPGRVRGSSEDRKLVFVDTGVGAWWAENWIGASNNDAVFYVVHPGQIKIGLAADSQCAEAVFKAKESMGSYEVLFLRLQAGGFVRELRMESQNVGTHAVPPMGAVVKIFWMASSAFVLRREDGEKIEAVP